MPFKDQEWRGQSRRERIPLLDEQTPDSLENRDKSKESGKLKKVERKTCKERMEKEK
jgi:hypothetical protein